LRLPKIKVQNLKAMDGASNPWTQASKGVKGSFEVAGHFSAASSDNGRMQKRPPTVTAEQAARLEPGLARLGALGHESLQRLAAIAPLLPPGLREGLKAGPIDGQTWCLLVPSNAASAKLRQMEPALLAHLRTRGWNVQQLRLKILAR
jgi:hypothetical protein